MFNDWTQQEKKASLELVKELIISDGITLEEKNILINEVLSSFSLKKESREKIENRFLNHNKFVLEIDLKNLENIKK